MIKFQVGDKVLLKSLKTFTKIREVHVIKGYNNEDIRRYKVVGLEGTWLEWEMESVGSVKGKEAIFRWLAPK